MKEKSFNSFINWCKENENIRTVILTSSRANQIAASDILSDYDIELYVKDLSLYKENDNWMTCFPKILVKWPYKPFEQIKPNWINRLIQLNNGERFDILITDELPKYHDNFNAGYKVLLDKDKITEHIQEPINNNLNINKPSEEEYKDRLNSFFWDVLYIPKSLLRDELFYTKYMMEGIVREKFQTILEWYIGLNNGWNVGTNKCGRYFKNYLEQKLWNEIEETFPGYKEDEIWKSLHKLFELTCKLSKAIAVGLSYEYPEKQEQEIREYIGNLVLLKGSKKIARHGSFRT